MTTMAVGSVVGGTKFGPYFELFVTLSEKVLIGPAFYPSDKSIGIMYIQHS